MMAAYQICTFIDSKTAKGHLIGIGNCFGLIAPVEDHNYKLCSICFDLCDIIFQLLFASKMILQLVKVVEAKPNYVKAQLLLAILCIAREDYQKAGKSVYKVLQIDRNHPKALWYKSIVKANTGSRTEREPEKRKLKNVLSHRQMEDDDVIIPPSYRENTKDMAVVNILAGLLLEELNPGEGDCFGD